MPTIPCEIVVKEVLPFIRRQFASRMKKEGKKQTEIARELGITGAAVSFYLSESRAKPLGKKAEAAIAKAVDEFYSKKEGFDKKVCEICRSLRYSGAVCGIASKCSTQKGCNVCKSPC